MRRPITTGKKSKSSIYLEPQLLLDAQDLAFANRQSWPEYIENVIKKDVEQNRKKIEAFRALNDK